MTRVALYARYSSDLQRPASIPDQFRECRAHAATRGWTIVAEYSDAATSGATMLRPGVQALMHAARAREFDVVLAEGMDRLSRDLADTAGILKRLRFAGVGLHTILEGDVGSMHVGLKGTMNELYIAELAVRTHRGMKGRVMLGKLAGGLCYGYRPVYGAPGDREVDQSEADVVRNIYKWFIDGVAPKAIARRLNGDGVAGPRGRVWSPSTIHGHASLGTGILNNELYVGRLVWNRQRYVKDPDTGRRLARPNAAADRVVTDVPHLRIIDDTTWDATKARQASTRLATRTNIGRARRPRYLFSGLTTCAVCHGGFTLGSKDRLICYNARERGTCTNRRAIKRQEVESRVLVAMQERFFDPGHFGAFCEAFTAELTRLRREQLASQAGQRHELAGVERRLKEIVRAISEGYRSESMKTELQDLEEKKARLTASLVVPQVPALHPNMAHIYREKATALAAGLVDEAHLDEARQAVRGFIERIEIPPDGLLQVVGSLGTMLELAQGRLKPGAIACGIDGCGGPLPLMPHASFVIAA
jgi:DNA invertase Pin-like site-specific DNA recombinase